MAIIDWRTVLANVLRNGSTLAVEAERCGVSEEELKKLGDEQLGKKNRGWCEAKRRSKNNEKLARRNTKSVPTPIVSVPSPAQLTQTVEERQALPPTLVRKPSVEVEPDKPEPLPPTLAKKPTLEALEAKKASRIAELETVSDQLAEVRQVADTRNETARLAAVVSGKAKHAYEEAKKALEESEEAWRNAKAEADEAAVEVAKVEAEQAKIEAELQTLDTEIDKIKEEKSKEVYLVDPWYTGTLPELGQFFSSEHMEGVEFVKVPKDYTLEVVAQSVALYEQTRDFFRAKAFTELVLMYQCQDIPYTLLAESKIKEFMEMYF